MKIEENKDDIIATITDELYVILHKKYATVHIIQEYHDPAPDPQPSDPLIVEMDIPQQIISLGEILVKLGPKLELIQSNKESDEVITPEEIMRRFEELISPGNCYRYLLVVNPELKELMRKHGKLCEQCRKPFIPQPYWSEYAPRITHYPTEKVCGFCVYNMDAYDHSMILQEDW